MQETWVWSLGLEGPVWECVWWGAGGVLDMNEFHSPPCMENPMDRGPWWATVQSHKRVRHSLAIKWQQQDTFIDPTEWGRYSLLGASIALYLVITSQCLVVPCLFLGLLTVDMKFFEDSYLFTAMSQCLNGCPVLGKHYHSSSGSQNPEA